MVLVLKTGLLMVVLGQLSDPDHRQLIVGVVVIAFWFG
jgi:hypothetical protein